MKRVIKDPMDKVASCIADITDALNEHFESKGMTKSEAKEMYQVQLERGDDGEKVITVFAEVNYDEFSSVAPKLNKAVQKLDSESYFDAVEPGVFQAVVNDASKEKNPDPIFNDSNIKPVVERVLRQISNQFGEKLNLDDLYYTADGYVGPGGDDEDLVRIFVEASGSTLETMAYVDMRKSETYSASQMKADLADELYSKLINSTVSKEQQ